MSNPIPPPAVEVAIVGAGLCGLYAASLLADANVDYVLLEAQSRLGGRIASEFVPASLSAPGGRYDLGPTWFWPDAQRRMSALVAELNLESFEPPDAGAFIYEMSASQRERMVAGPGSGGAMRIQGGMQSLVTALAAGIQPSRLRLAQQLTGLRCVDPDIELELLSEGGAATLLRARHVISTLPPRLLANDLGFKPPLPQALRDNWAAIPTWMAAHAKFVAVYERPFWREAGLSGHAQSRVGPLVEIHDATAPGEQPALFGFVGVPAVIRQRSAEALQHQALAQLARLFGEQALLPVQRFYRDWSVEPFVAAPADALPPSHHPAYGQHQPLPAAWAKFLILAGTETAASHGGYLEGALEAAQAAVAQVLATRKGQDQDKSMLPAAG